jgi:hypothetical protein
MELATKLILPETFAAIGAKFLAPPKMLKT